jgi:DNA ligase-1
VKRFAALYAALDETTRTHRKVDALVRYLRESPPADAVWAIRFLMGRKPRQAVPTASIREWAAEVAGIPAWLFEASYDVVGDLAETVSLLLPESGNAGGGSLRHWVEDRLLPLRELELEDRKAAVLAAWNEMDTPQRFVFNKLITGGFRVGVSARLVTRALARFSGLPEAVLAHRLMGKWDPTPEFFDFLLSTDTRDADRSRPYPFFLAYPLEDDPAELGPLSEWHVEWKWDGIRAQLVRRGGETFLWSRGEELVTEKYPEIAEAAEALPDGTVLDGELLPWKNGRPLPFGELQRRIGRKKLTAKILSEVPVILLAYDLLEDGSRDIREAPFERRRNRLAEIVAGTNSERLKLSPAVFGETWAALAEVREESRDRGVEGFMVKRRNSPYRVGRRRGDWWKWKVDPLAVDAVLIYAQRGHGKRSGLYTDYTFAVWDEDKLVPFAKAYSGLTDAEIRKVDRFIQRNTLERFGPVRSVRPELVFELHFEGIRPSTRHKSGVAVRFPRISRWREDKPPAEADTLETVRALLPPGAK